MQQFLALEKAQRRRTLIRGDAGLGTDANVNWLLWQDYQVLMKGYSGTRAKSLATRLQEDDWLEDRQRKRWIAPARGAPRFGRKLNVFVLRWANRKGKLRYGTLLSTLLELEAHSTWRLYDGRGAVEVEIKTDKQGLRLPKRRKKSFAAQEGLILLTDLAHNLLSWFHHWVLEETAFADFGAKRIVDELMCIPGRVEIVNGRLEKVVLLESHPYAEQMRLILQNLLKRFAIP